MATRGIELIISFVAWDTANNVGKTGLNDITLQWFTTKAGLGGIKEYISTAIQELDATDAPGVYYVTIEALDTDVDMGMLCGISATADVSIMPVNIQFERLPDFDPDEAQGVRDVFRIASSSTAAVKLSSQINSIEQGTAQSIPATNQIELESSTASNTLDLTDMVILITSGNGTTQTRRITSYVIGTRIATVDRDWDFTPTGATYHILGLIL